MSPAGPPGVPNPFEGMPMFGDLAKLFSQQGPVNWEIARQIAMWVTTQGRPEPNVEPLARMRLEELGRVADMHVREISGLSTSTAGGAATIRPVARTEWAMTTLDAYRPLLEALAESLDGGMAAAMEAGEDDSGDPLAGLLGSLGQMMGPVLLGLQSGSMVGHLATRVLSQYDLPIPRPPSDDVLVVAPNLEQFVEDWSLPEDDVRLWVCVDALTHHAVIGRPHVRDRLNALLQEYVSSFRPDPSALEEKMGTVDPADPASWQRALGDPEVVLGAMQSDAQRRLVPQLEALTATITGFVDHVVDRIGSRLISSYGPLTEALRRRRVERNEGDRFVERVFGLQLDQRQYDRGAAFVNGVVERAGEDALARLWHSERELPTPADVDAPGLWLERIDLPD